MLFSPNINAFRPAVIRENIYSTGPFIVMGLHLNKLEFPCNNVKWNFNQNQYLQTKWQHSPLRCHCLRSTNIQIQLTSNIVYIPQTGGQFQGTCNN